MKKLNPLCRILCCFFVAYMVLPTSLIAQLTIVGPLVSTTNTVRVTLTGTASTNAHVIFFTPYLATNSGSWTRMTTGAVGQTTFDLPMPTNTVGFFRAGIAPVPTLTVATPSFSPAGGSYAAPTNVVISCATLNALIYYTTNGSTPTLLDNYIANGGSVYLDRITTLKAKAFLYGYTDSGVASDTYNINSAPFAYAGAQQILSSGSTTLQGFVADDGLPSGAIYTTNWSQLTGPGTVTFGNSHLTNSSATFSADGIYVLQLSASDGQYTNSSTVTIAVNPAISVSLTSPTNGSTYTVPTNILLQASASGSVTQVLLYANSTLIGEATGSPLSLNWKSVPAGTLALTAVAIGSDPNNYSLASDPVNITVNWPTNIGQVAFSATDLQIPVAGLPITIARQFDTRGASGSFGPNGRLDYEGIKIERNASLSSGWTGRQAGTLSFIYSLEDTSSHLITVSLSDSEKYYFRPVAEFLNGGIYTSTINSFSPPRYQAGNRGRLSFVSVAGSQGALQISPTPGNVGYDDYNFSGWKNSPVQVVQGSGLNPYNPSFTQFVFTAPNGTQYRFNTDGTVASKTDRNGNSLSYGSSGIVHSSGKQIAFTRDGSNYITEVYDPIALDTSGSPALTYAYDGNGNLTNFSRLIQRSPSVYEHTAFAYTNAAFPHHVTSITDPRGIAVARYVYDTQGRLVTQYDALNRTTTYVYDTATRRQVITDRLGNTTVQTFTDSGQVASVRDASGGVTSYQYDTQGHQIAQIDPANETTSFEYDQNDNLTGTSDPLGDATSTTYDSFNNPLVVIDARGNGTTNEYDGNGNLVTATSALGIITGYSYDAQGNLVGETNAMGLSEQVATVNQYDSFGNLTNVATLNAANTTVKQIGYAYDSNGNKLMEIKSRTLPVGGIEVMTNQWIYDGANRLMAAVDPLNNSNLTFYNGLGKASYTVNALNQTNSNFYDAIGLLTNTTYADGLSVTFSYDAEGRQTQQTDRGNHVTTYSYDAVGRVTRTVFPDGSYTSTFYDAAGRPFQTSQGPASTGLTPGPSDLPTQYYYDAAGRVIGTTNALGFGSGFAYDANGNQTNTIDSLNHRTAFEYDVINRQTKITYFDGTSESYVYDGLGRKVAVTNQANLVTSYAYDALGRLVAVTNAVGTTQQTVTSYIFDELGNLLKQIDSLNHTNSFEYDSLGRKTKEALPGNQVATFSYDALGNPIRMTNFNGIVLTNQYDALNRLTNRSAAGNYRIAFGYSPTGQRTNMLDASGTNAYAYDNLDRLITKTTPQGTLTYTYDLFGNIASVVSSTSNGTKVNYFYDVLNRLTNVVDRFTNNTFYAYDSVGNLQSCRYQNNVTNAYTYNSLNRLTNISVTTASGSIASFNYTLAAAGNRTTLIQTVNGISRTNQWGFDSLYRLTNEVFTGAAPTGSVGYKHDLVGNRTNRTSTVSGITNQAFAYNSNDQLVADAYDANGNTRTNGANSFFYDAENRLTNASVGGTSITIIYDGDGNRVRKTVGGVTTYYLVDDRNLSGNPQVLEELTTIGGTPDRLYTHGLDLICQRQSAGTTSFYGYDGGGSVRFLTAPNASITDTYAYDAFGILIASTGSTPNNYLYAGEQSDPQLNLYYLRARYESPGTGRFVTRDNFVGHPEQPSSLHKYLYTANDPVNNIDPSGNDFSLSSLDAIGFHFSLGAILSPIAAELDDNTTKVLWSETGSVYPGLKKGATNSSYANWDSGSRALLNKARERIAEVVNAGKDPVAEPKTLPDVSGKNPIVWVKAQVDDVRAARKAAGKKASTDKFVMWPSDDGGKTPSATPEKIKASWPYDYKPYLSYGAFRVLARKSGDPVPVSDKIYFFFYNNVP